MNPSPVRGSLATTFAGQDISLLPDRAAWLAATSSLMLSDLHLGKAATFRARGLPVPSGGTARDLDRLTLLLRATGARRLVILGDLLHARAGRDPELLAEVARWRGGHAGLEVLLVRGNHDRSAGRVPAEWDMREVEEPHLDGDVAFVHHPDIATSQPAIGGHVHPVASIRDFDGASVRVPAFVKDPRRLILPSFGNFTGGHAVSAQPGRELLLVMAGRVIAAQR